MSLNATYEHIPSVSVIMGVYNQYQKEQLICAVNSIRVQTFRDFEFIIYDDGSDTEPAEFLREAAESDDRIRLIREDKNNGLAYSLNRCISEARGKYIARMDADDISDPQRLQTEFDFLEANPEWSWVGCNAFVFSKTEIYGEMKRPEAPNQYDYLAFSPFIHPSVMFRSEALEKSGGYSTSRETLRCEDYDLFMRLYQRGMRGYNLQKALLYYRQGIEAYKKRSMKNRVREAKVRGTHFPKMDIPKAKCIAYTVRPVAAGFIPHRMIAWYKKQTVKERETDEYRTSDIQERLRAYNDYLYSMGFGRSPEDREEALVFSGEGRLHELHDSREAVPLSES